MIKEQPEPEWNKWREANKNAESSQEDNVPSEKEAPLANTETLVDEGETDYKRKPGQSWKTQSFRIGKGSWNATVYSSNP